MQVAIKKISGLSGILFASCIFFAHASAKTADTTFLVKTTSADGMTFNRVYVNPDNKNWRYDSLSFVHIIDPKSKHPFGGWIELKQYKNQYYAYYPCDLGNIYRLYIDKHSITEFRTETEAANILSLKTAKDRFIIEVEEPGSGKHRTVILHIVNAQKGLGVIENVGWKDPYRYILVVSANRLRNYPIIIHECSAKADEFNFQNPGFENLIKR